MKIEIYEVTPKQVVQLCKLVEKVDDAHWPDLHEIMTGQPRNRKVHTWAGELEHDDPGAIPFIKLASVKRTITRGKTTFSVEVEVLTEFGLWADRDETGDADGRDGCQGLFKTPQSIINEVWRILDIFPATPSEKPSFEWVYVDERENSSLPRCYRTFVL